ncbi:MAG TPA: hypothetical protein VFS51_02225, partial [Gemmatimonadales bacterium]|nr:hypothetical protein [Gemmatimonadales bacterium]
GQTHQNTPSVSFHLFASATAALFLAGCQPRRAEPEPMACNPAPEPETLLPPGSAERLGGTYRLQLVATEGSKSGESVEGTLRIQLYDRALRAVTVHGIRDTAASYVLYGSVDVDLDGVGAVRPGDPGAEDPMRPGVLVIERKGTVVLRLGSEANRRDVARFDGGYTALRVREITEIRFRGTWASGVHAQRSAGYFCAERVTEGR